MRRWLTLLALGGCAPTAQGLRATPPGSGPMVVVDWEAEPLAELPFPNDLATITDPTSPTGLRVNIATEAKTDFESAARRKLDELTGFGVYQPITVRFDDRIDVADVISRHPNDFHLPEAFDDDAVYLIDITPSSPDYGRAMPLDLGHGRYPMDVFDTQRYFPNDPRAGEQSILFETVDEDLNGNGVIDPGEDTDNDGVLDIANVWPPGADPVTNLLTWYDLERNSMILRPVIPLREETTYAVVLTNRLRDLDGQPVRSPWPYVNHTRQTGPLRALEDVLPDLGLGVDDVAFTWSYTTGRVTGDLRDLHRAIFDHAGPFAWLADAYPPGITELLDMSNAEGIEAWNLPTSRLMNALVPLGVVDVPDADTLIGTYEQYGGRIVTGAFVTPYLLTDVDDGGTDDSDEWWKLDPFTGEAAHGPQRVVFTCALPADSDTVQQPYPTMFYGHGYGSNRLEVLLFGFVANRLGMAACSIDFPGHGVAEDPEEMAQYQGILELTGLAQAFHSLLDNRARDLNNDGTPDSGGDQWSADPFHTRDMVRQAVVDWMQVIRSFELCGQGTSRLLKYDATGAPVDTGQTAMSCDWDGNGVPDLGAGAAITVAGGSLGGINAGVAAAVLPEVDAWVPVVPGGGIVDVGVRTEIGGAVEAFVGRLMNPIILGLPTEGGLRVVQLVNSVTDMRELPIATLSTVPAGGRAVVSNLRNGETHEAAILPDGRFRISIGADGLEAGEKRLAAGIPQTGPEDGVVYEIPDNDGLGDPLRVEIYDAAGALVADLDTWETDVVHEGVTMRAGSPLVAGTDGNGKIRGSYDARRLAFISAMVLEAGDPIAYAPHYFLEPFEDLGGQPTNVLMMPNPGDPIVSVNTGIAMARAAGVIDWRTIDPRYGMTQDAYLIDRGVVRGIEERGPYTNDEGVPVLFDVDDLDDGTDGWGAPSDPEPLRLTVTTPAGQSGLRLNYVWPFGAHGFVLDAEPDFNWVSYVLHSLGDYCAKGGAVVEDRPCYATADCPDFPPLLLDEVNP